jgi:hypothetical protein
MKIARMRHEIKLRWNKINSNHKKDFPDAYLDDIINDSIHEYVEIFYSGHNPKRYNLGFEVTQQRIDMLSTLVVPDNSSVTATHVSGNKYNYNLSLLNPQYSHFLRGAVIVDACDSLSIPINIIRHNDFDHKMDDENTKPSLKWKRALGLIKGSTSPALEVLYVYTDDNYVATKLKIEYLRKPRKVFSGGYDSLEFLLGDTTAYKSADTPVDCDLPEQYHTLVVDIAVQNIARMLEDPNKFQITEEKIFKQV